MPLLLPFDWHLCNHPVSVQCLVIAMLVDPRVTAIQYGNAMFILQRSPLAVYRGEISPPKIGGLGGSSLIRTVLRVTANLLLDIDCYKSEVPQLAFG